MDFITIAGIKVMQSECEPSNSDFIGCDDPLYDIGESNSQDDLEDELNKTIERKCGEIFIGQDDVFSFLCSLCEAPFTKIQHFFSHVLVDHSNKSDFEHQISDDGDDSKSNSYKYTTEQSDIPIKKESSDSSESENENEADINSLILNDTIYEEHVQSLRNTPTLDNTENIIIPDHNQEIVITSETLITNDQGGKETKEETTESSKSKNPDKKATIKSVKSDQNQIVYDSKTCDICGKKLCSAKSLHRHKSTGKCLKKVESASISTGNEEDTIVDKRPVCDICGKKLSSERSLRRHKSTGKCSRRIDGLTCELCGKTFRNPKYLRWHYIFSKRGHDPEKVAEIQAAYRSKLKKHRSESLKCRICGIYCRDVAYRLDHERIHTGERPFVCKVCGKDFRTKPLWRQHEKNHTTENRYMCDLCGLACKTAQILQLHRLRHGEKRVSCPYCEKKFYSTSELIIHKRTHTGEKPYKCDLCPQSFTTSSTLALHRRRHLGIKTHRCEFCSEEFYSKQQLTCHVRHHTGERPYCCATCGECFVHRGGLRVHEQTHSTSLNFVCSICGKAYKTSSSLYAHKRTHKKVKQTKKSDSDSGAGA